MKKNYEGYESLLTEVIDDFLKNLPMTLTLIDDLMKKKDLNGLHIIVHRLRGACSIFYAPKVNRALTRLEKAAGCSHPVGLEAAHKKAIAEIEILRKELLSEHSLKSA